MIEGQISTHPGGGRTEEISKVYFVKLFPEILL